MLTQGRVVVNNCTDMIEKVHFVYVYHVMM